MSAITGRQQPLGLHKRSDSGAPTPHVADDQLAGGIHAINFEKFGSQFGT